MKQVQNQQIILWGRETASSYYSLTNSKCKMDRGSDAYLIIELITKPLITCL
ncbi:hypothetical protein [Fulvivirga sp. M361]|uniref:hypothetical protein n=1 Tax=Fulvivirga sp. M361 TaxID=2594266 RepID=UPI00162510D6|nr:hypothetical protein [Fulvivirga sp. M361]